MNFKRIFLIIIWTTFVFIEMISGQATLAENSSFVRTTLFNELFDANDNNWITDNRYISARFENGNYIVKCKNYQGYNGLSFLKIPLDQNGDFEIETSLQILKGSGGLIFGMNEKFDHYRIEITQKYELVVIRNANSINRIDNLFTKSILAYVKVYSPFKITLKKINNVYYLYINGTFLKEFNNIVLTGKQLGFNVGLNSEISVDYLTVNYLEKPSSPILAEQKAEKTQVVAPPPQPKAEVIVPVLKAPLIIWLSPSTDTVSIDSYSAKIRTVVNSETDLKSVMVYVNGVSSGEVELKPMTGEKGKYIAEKTVSFNPGQNSIYLIAANAGGASKSDLRYFKNPAASLPAVTWGNLPRQVSVVNTDMFNIEVCINSPSGLNSAKILVNGEDRGGDNIFQPSGSGDCNYKWQKPVILREGDNNIYIIASNIAGSITSEKRVIKYQPAMAEKRLALVLGNAEYGSKTSLKNPVNDANLMEATLKDLGFDVIKRLNASKSDMELAIREFSQKLSSYNVALLYYAGHGLQIDGQNYLIPTDANLAQKNDCKFEAVALNFITDEFKMHPENTNVVILDACRNDPYRSWVRGEELGFKALSPINGTIISFATSEGATAADGSGANGLFTEELVKQMIVPQAIESVFKQTRRQVITRSGGQQTPTEWSYLTGDFYFIK